MCLFWQLFKEVNKEPNADGLSTEDFRYAISRAPDFQRYMYVLLLHVYNTFTKVC